MSGLAISAPRPTFYYSSRTKKRTKQYISVRVLTYEAVHNLDSWIGAEQSEMAA